MPPQGIDCPRPTATGKGREKMSETGGSAARLAIHELVLANRILAYEGIIDDFGHVSLRDPGDPGFYYLSRSRSPAVVTRDDIMRFDLDSRSADPADPRRPYNERALHGCVYAARPDVQA